MRRPPGLWILLSAGVVWLSLQDAYGLRATSLIFGKTTTTTTTTTAKAITDENVEEENATTTDLGADANSTKPTLTGNPQIDYIWDPNLPQELNGYNLSDYPFYERVPEDIDFKCDGLHDGFYASVLHKCQVYHHCLFGTRYDFLCANYTAFDQKTFICHFASEVDCANSKKFWHRNDALYKAATTTTVKPFVIYTTAPPSAPVLPLTAAPLPLGPGLRRPVGGRRRPFRRRRPQIDYYDEEYYDYYYEEIPRSNRGRKRPRPRPRPVYEDDYEDYVAEERYQRRGGGSRRDEERRPYDRRSGNRRRNKDRVKEEYELEVADGYEDEEYGVGSRRKTNNKKKPDDSAEEGYLTNRKRRPLNDRSEEFEKPNSRKNQKRPIDDYEDDSLQGDDVRSYERPRKNNEGRAKPKDDTTSRTIIKPLSGTIYDRPRMPPKIKLPVPKNEAEKYTYKSVETQAASTNQDYEYYDNYEEEPVQVQQISRKPQTEVRSRNRGDNSRKQVSPQSRPKRPETYVEEKPRSKTNRNTPKISVTEDYYDEYEEQEKEVQIPLVVRNGSTRTKPLSISTTTTTTEAIAEKGEQPVRLVKRPFLPSRGGNPYAARGLLPVGSKAVGTTPEKTLGENVFDDNLRNEGKSYNVESEMFKPSPPITEVPVSNNAVVDSHAPYQSQSFSEPGTTQKPKVLERNPLDINAEEYDVTLNDALNPTLPNVPIRGSPIGFSSGNDYSFTGYQRSRYNLEPVANPSSAEYIYQVKPQRQVYQPQREHFVNSNVEYKGQYSNYRPRQVQQQTEVYHHCLFGTRYDFLCANYTAFDQTLFNCNFVSNVDCENSKKYWHRNDELYIEKSTTTVAPAINYNFYTPPPQGSPLTVSPIGAAPSLQEGSIEVSQTRRQAALRPRATRPPVRPFYDYYDDYEELPRPKSRKRLRPRPRPVYYDDYGDELDDVRISRRSGGRRPNNRRGRPSRRSKDRRKLEYEDEDYAYEDDLVLTPKQPKAKRREILDDYVYEDERPYAKRRPQNRRDNKPYRKNRPVEDYDYVEDERYDRRKLKDETGDRRRLLNEENKKTPRLGKRRPPSQEYEDDLQQADDARSYDRPRKVIKGSIKPPADGRPIIKPVSGTIYDRPRVAPRINLPVPKNAADKYAYKPIGTPTTPTANVEEEYDDYEEVALSASNKKTEASPGSSTTKGAQQKSIKSETAVVNDKEVTEDSKVDYEDELSQSEKATSKTTTTAESAIEHSSMPVIRKFKRPFLPSRGGNPYTARNLQPVGGKAKDEAQEIDLGESSVMKSVADPVETVNSKDNADVNLDIKQVAAIPKTPLVTKVTITTASEESTLKTPLQETAKEEVKSGIIRIKVPIRVKPFAEEESKPQNLYENNKYISESTTTVQPPKLAKEDILNGNYDVTLNEAISPIIPNLPVRGLGSYNPATDYTYKRFQRPTKYVILDPVVSSGNTYYVK